MRRSAIDCAQRGIGNLLANWPLVAVQWLAGLLLTAFLFIGLLPPLAVLGLDGLEALVSATGDWEGWLLDTADRLTALALPLLLSLVATMAIWMIAMLVYCYLQAGVFGILVAGEQQAEATVDQGWRGFRVFSGRLFLETSGRYLWRFFWFLNLFFVVLTVLLLLTLVWVMLIFWGTQKWGAPAGLGIGCGGALPLTFTGIAVTLWFSLGQADLARADSGVVTAARRGLEVLARRLGGVLLLYLLLLAASFGVGMLFVPISLAADFAFRGDWWVQLTAGAVVSAVQSIPGTALAMALWAALVALVQSEAGVSPQA